MNLNRILYLGALTCALAMAEPAAAQMQPAGTGEPAYTNSAQNTQWLEWPAVSGTDGYRAQFSYYENNALKAAPTHPLSNGGTIWANWSGVATLQHGGQYGICAQGSYSFPNDSLYFPDGPNSCSMGTMLGRRAHTTIDRSKPTAALKLNNGAGYTRTASIPLQVDFSDDVAGPFPANFLCFQFGGGPTGVCDSGAGYVYGYNPACSVPATGGKSTTFTCTANYGAGPDGTIWACVIAADAAIPDNPNSADQRATADRANLSAATCDDVVLDRKAPTVTVTAPTSAKVGAGVPFSSTATDATSGVKARTWTWGDGTPTASAATTTHRFARPGTYTVQRRVVDWAGNATTVKKVITITAARTGAGATTTSGGSTPPAGDEPGGRGLTPFAAGRAGDTKLGRGPDALPDGRFHGKRPAGTFAVR